MGMYSTPTCMGSRSGGLISAAWATMMYFGKDGYIQCMKQIMDATQKIKKGIEEIEELEIMGNPVISIIALKESKLAIERMNDSNEGQKSWNIFNIDDAMKKRGWKVNRCLYPNCIHFCFTMANCKDPDGFIQALKESVIEVTQSPETFEQSSGAMYGAVVKIPNSGFKNDILTSYMDVVYGVYGT